MRLKIIRLADVQSGGASVSYRPERGWQISSPLPPEETAAAWEVKDSKEVLFAFTFLRSQAKDWRTDYFLSTEELEKKLQAGKVRAVLSRTAFLLIETRTSYERLYYGSTCAGALTELLRSALPGGTLPLVVDLIADKDEGGRVQLVDGFTHCGFQQQFRLRRMTRIQKRLQDLAVPADKFARPSETDEITRLLEERKSPYKAIVAFSGTKEYGGRTLTEADVNGFPSKDIEENMEHDPYRILVVADKFQTGYDQPLLHTMYVDKVLTDVKAVQTLSRLNRCHPKKRDTFVLDFCNDVEDIQKSFQRFYKTTILSKETDPNKLNDLIAEIESANIYTEEEVKALNEKYWAAEPREMLDPIVNKAVERFKWLDENDKIRTKSSIKSFLRTYTFIAAVMPYKSIEWEMLNTYYSLLVHKLPVLKDEDLTEGLIDAIDFDQYRLIKNEEQKIELENKDSEIDPIPVGNPKGGKEPDMQKLSDILDEFNKINWTNIEVVKQQLDELPTRLQSDVTFVNAVKNSNRETAMQQCASSMMAIVAGMLNENTEFCRYYLDHPDFMNAINQRVFSYVYDQLNQESKAGESHPNTKYVFPGNEEVKFSIAAEDK